MTDPTPPAVGAALTGLLDCLDGLRRMADSTFLYELGTVRFRPCDDEIDLRIASPTNYKHLTAHQRLPFEPLRHKAKTHALALRDGLRSIPLIAFWNPVFAITMANNGPSDRTRIKVYEEIFGGDKSSCDIVARYLEQSCARLAGVACDQDAARRHFLVGNLDVTAPGPEHALLLAACLGEDACVAARDMEKVMSRLSPVRETYPKAHTLE